MVIIVLPDLNQEKERESCKNQVSSSQSAMRELLITESYYKYVKNGDILIIAHR